MNASQALDDAKRLMCDIGERMYQRQLVAGSEGNLSLRSKDNEILCTPTGLCKGRLSPSDLCLVTPEGDPLAGDRSPSSEIKLHLEILHARSDIQAVVHAHPPYATTLAVLKQPLPRAVTPESEVFFGKVAIAHYETPGTKAFAETVLPFLSDSNACLLAHHGGVTYGNSLEHAYHLMEMLEAHCRTIYLARQLGEIPTIPAGKLPELVALRKQLYSYE
ncbi:MAG: class II aldolase/adducin family protein [Lacipirellulaceae bacterium]